MNEKRTSGVVSVAELITLKTDSRLKDLVGEAADRDGVPMGEWIAKVLAQKLGRPDLAAVPRKRMGRPRKKLAVAK